MTGARHTLAQRFALEVVLGRLSPELGKLVLRAAYDPGEAPRSAVQEHVSYHRLCDRTREWSAAALRKVRLSDLADLLERTRVLGVDGAVAAEQTLRTARMVLDAEQFPDALGPLLDSARKVVLETQKVMSVAVHAGDLDAEPQQLRIGTAAASRAFVAARGFIGNAPAEARTTVEAMRSV